jgi:hypothetical protein
MDPRNTIEDATTPAELVAALTALNAVDPWRMMHVLTESQFPGLNILNATRIPPATAFSSRVPSVQRRLAAPVLGAQWTIRHYASSPKGRKGSPPDHNEINSAFILTGWNITLKHTNLADWRHVGNIGFTFHVIAINGEVPDRKWLGDTDWYAEWSFDEVDDCWVSGDLLGPLNTAKNTADAERVFTDRVAGNRIFRGTGPQVREALALRLGQSGAGMDAKDRVRELDKVVGDTLELKVAHTLKVKEWKRR